MNNLIDIYKSCRKENNIWLVNEIYFLKVVEFWFRYFEYVIDIYEEEGIEITNLLNPNLKKSIFNAFDSNKLFHKEKKSKIEKIFKLILFNLYKTRNGFIYGGSRSKIQSLNCYLLKNRLESVKVNINLNFKNEFLLESGKYHSSIKVQLIDQIIPFEFFAESLNKKIHLPTNILGSALTFLDFNGVYLKLLLQPNLIKIIGFQHGGAYGEWRVNEIETFEKSISNEYFGWGLMNQNIVQHRYKKYNRGKKANLILWIGRDKFRYSNNTKFHLEMGKHFLEFEHIKFFKDKLKEFPILFLPHPRGEVSYYNSIFNNIDIIKFQDTEKNIAKFANLVIFDCLSHSLIYFCIHNKIPFIILLKEIPLKNLTKKACDFYLLLARNNILFEEVKLSSNFDYIFNYLNKKTNYPFNNDLFNAIDYFFLNKEQN